mmetsp:Transcript_1388/g.2380  ORF Transcript_1388/g.2380 Transcript_1388/m.2380 type:complete len:312 (-) Transcript_1388:109-1044(-)
MAAGERRGIWVGLAGNETGANYGIHSLGHTSDKRERRACQAQVGFYNGAAGKGSGACYEVVRRGEASNYVRTAPFANDSLEWRHSVRRRGQRSSLSADQMTRGEFQATMHATWKPQKPQEGELLASLQQRLVTLGVSGIAALARRMRALDNSSTKLLNCDDFTAVALEQGVASTQEECQALFRLFDIDGTGNLDYREFLVAACGTLNERRREVVQAAFTSLDRGNAGRVRRVDVLNGFDARAHPDVRAGQRSAEEVMDEFYDFFTAGGEREPITLAEFAVFYAAISSNTDDDRHFERISLDVWQLPGELCM